MVKPRFSSATKSEKGYPTSHSLIHRPNCPDTKLDEINEAKVDCHQSEVNYDIGQTDSPRQDRGPALRNFTQSFDSKDKVRGEMSRELSDLKAFRDQSNSFYEGKIAEVRALGSKMTQYGPMEQLSKITEKLNLSSTTQNMLKKVVNRTGQ